MKWFALVVSNYPRNECIFRNCPIIDGTIADFYRKTAPGD